MPRKYTLTPEGRTSRKAKGRKHSLETRLKMSEAAINRGSNKPATGTLKQCVVCSGEFYATPYRAKTRVCSKVCLHKDSEYLDKLKRADKSYMQTAAYSAATGDPKTPAYKKYANKVSRLSEQVYKENIDVLNPNRHRRTLCGVSGGYQLDHIISKRYGFEQGIPAEELSKLENLRLISWEENLKKSKHVRLQV